MSFYLKYYFLLYAIIFFAAHNSSAQKPFDCNGRIFRVLEEQGGSTFQEILIDLQTGEPTFIDLKYFSGLRINGIAYRPADNFIYGVLLEEPYVLCRIDANYELERLAELPLPTSMLFVSGDVSPDERYLVQLGYSPDEDGNLLALIDLESLDYTATILPAAKTDPYTKVQAADIAFHPTLDLLFGYEHSEGRLITIDLNSALIDNSTYPTIDSIKGNMPSIFFDAYGKLYGVGAELNVYTNRNLYGFDTDDGSAELIEVMGFERNQDACSCPFKVKLLNRVSSRIGHPCTELNFEFTLINRTDRTQENVTLSDTFPIGTIITHIDELPFLGNISSGEGSSILTIENINLPVGTFKFNLTLEILENTLPAEIENQAFLDHIFLNSLTQTTRIFSDDPLTAQPDDPTLFSINALNITFDHIEPVICPDDTLWINSGIYGADQYAWSTGENTNQIYITKAGEYSVTVTSGCDEVFHSIDVREEKIDLELGHDFLAELREPIELIPNIFSNGEVRSFFWEESAINSMECYTCPTGLVRPYQYTTYWLHIENEWGCRASDSISIDVVNYKLYAPNAFSPNGDKINDLFFLQSQQLYSIEYFRVYDRWGGLLYEAKDFFSNDPTFGWDGTFSEKKMNTGVYVWLAKFQSLDGRFHVAKGDINLVR